MPQASDNEKRRIDDLNILGSSELVTPNSLIADYPASSVQNFVYLSRKAANDIVYGTDDRLLVVVGPCSVHDPKAALEYAGKLAKIKDGLSDDLHLVMRVYFEKPRTTHGWKGLINDPDLNETFNINKGLRLARKLLLDINKSGIPCGVEYLDTISPQYIADLVTWGAIGARTTESQVHRELASGLSSAVGFKNGTDGNTMIAAHAMLAANRPHHFLSVTKDGNTAIFSTRGNRHTHVILRGGSSGTNYDSKSIAEVAKSLAGFGLPTHVMIDCSHANSGKDHNNQPKVARAVCKQASSGDLRIIGVMLESNLVEGRQDIGDNMTYGMSVTDACLGWDETTPVLEELAQAVRKRRMAQIDRE